jgi:PAS domain-containing protein
MAKSKFNVRTRRLPGRGPKTASKNLGNTRRKTAAAESVGSPNYYIDNLACPALLIDAERRIEVANEGFYKLFGWPTKALQLGETFAAFAQRTILNRHDGILELGDYIGTEDNQQTNSYQLSIGNDSVRLYCARTPDSKTLLSFSTTIRTELHGVTRYNKPNGD